MIARTLLALAFATQASEVSLIERGRFQDANRAFAQIELNQYVRPGLTGARVRQMMTEQFPADSAFIASEIPADQTGRLRAFERVSPERFQVTTVEGRVFAITPGPKPATIKVDGKLVRLNRAPEFVADMRAALGKTIALHGLGLLVPDRADAIMNIAATILLAAALGAYSAWSSSRKTTTENYLARLASECTDDRDKRKVPFADSRTAAFFTQSIERQILPASAGKLRCSDYVQAVLRAGPADQLRAGDPRKTCEQLRAYVGCVEEYRNQPAPARVQHASDERPAATH